MTTDNSAIAVFTSGAADKLIADGYTGNWATKAARAQTFEYVVCVRNGRPPSPKDVPNGTAFLIGRIGRVHEVAETTSDGRPRVAIGFTEYARVNVPNAWGNSSNPVWYTDLDTLGINLEELEFQPVPNADAIELAKPEIAAGALDFAQARHGLSLRYGVPPKAIEIVIHG